MTAKQYLNSYRHLEARYNAALEELKSVETDIITLKSPSLEDRVQTSPKNDPIGELVCEMESRKVKLGMDVMRYKANMINIREQIRAVGEINSDYAVILVMRYVLNKDWKFICGDNGINMSRSQANLLHSRALQAFDSKFRPLYGDK